MVLDLHHRAGPVGLAAAFLAFASAGGVLLEGDTVPGDTVPSDTVPGNTVPSNTVPVDPNPYLSFLPADAAPDYAYWEAEMARRARLRRLDRSALAAKAVVVESEPNDTRDTAKVLTGFGTGTGEDPAFDVNGSFSAASPPAAIGPFAEDDGAIPLASPTGLVAGSAVTLSGTIGDGPYGSAGTGSGDFDFFEIPGVAQGQLIVIDVDTALPFDEDLDPIIALYDSAGTIVAINEDEDPAVTFDSFLAVSAPADGDYYLSIAGSDYPFLSLLSDPFDPTTGNGAASEGDYDVTIRLDDGDQDWIRFELEVCDILGVSLVGAGLQLLLEDPEGTIVVASGQDLTGVHPPASPLPGGGEAVLSHVAALAGTYSLRALGAGGPGYTLEARVFRPPLTASPTAKTVFVDFDGARVDPAIFGGTSGEVELSPLADFLAGWGLGPGDEDAVIDATLAALVENLEADPRFRGPNGAFAVDIRNSRDDPDPFGDPEVSRLIVGGTISQLGLATIGIAQSIDPGNFEAAETAVVLLDLLSAPSPNPNSLNSFGLGPGASKIDLVGVGLGNIAAHEAGHLTGSFHTEPQSAVSNLMDQGGNLANTVGVGADFTFGTADDVDVDFGRDLFVPTEGFAGLEDTLAIVACGCAIRPELFADGFESGDLAAWSQKVF